jgi:DNA-directed RNA polymerase subunit beta
MPIPAIRIIRPEPNRNFGRFGDAVEVPGLTDVQTRSYARFLQLDVPVDKREPLGLEGVLREIFPIESYDKTINLEYLRYELGKPRYTPDECRQLRLTYGRPFRVWLRLNKEQPVQEEVYLGDMPIMIGGGEFIINGAERVVVSQLHRSPASITSSRPKPATASCIRAGSSPSVAAGSRSTSPKKKRWASASISRASSRP